jgi:translation initiation factor 6 (eIF-6)
VSRESRILPQRFNYILLFIIHVLFFTMLTGCGYKPSSYETQKVMGESVSTEVIISMTDPENTVVLKDALDEAVIRRFQTALRHRHSAETHLKIELRNVVFSALQFDRNGYIVAYRTTINLVITRETKDLTKRYNAVGNYDFTISQNAIITDQQRYEAIQKSATKALDSFIAQVAAEGSRQKSE